MSCISTIQEAVRKANVVHAIRHCTWENFRGSDVRSKVDRNSWWCALPEVDEEQGWEEALADEGAAPEGGCSAVGGVGGEFVEFPRISPACFSTWYMASTSAHTG